jgi:undecaprenyl-diphosphatase
MFLNFLEVFILSAVQGITEFLPISSSAHLIILSSLANFKTSSLVIDVGAHLGSLFAILFYFRDDLLNYSKNIIIFKLICIGSVPLFIFGFFFYWTGLIYYLRDIQIIAWTTLIFGILLYIADKSKVKKKLGKNLNIKLILVIGFFQVLALIPGVSRAGIAITAGRFLKFDRYDSSKISFLLSIPALLGASILMIIDIKDISFEQNILLLNTVILSFIFSYITIVFFLKFIRKFSLNTFVIYRILISIFLFYIIFY